ncbi:hypothetical protein MTR_1g042810 [Medicago truncatula]|uniref:Uncharacterized protein n=1 Tax=Medicago truncatula TaxID=3880 RepID=G7I4N5_MEDTR|nr:hypothetical protein MTR_1g042810 [Medicago truncatula]
MESIKFVMAITFQAKWKQVAGGGVWLGTLKYVPPQSLKFDYLRCQFKWDNLASKNKWVVNFKCK